MALKVLHITNWYPNNRNPLETLFIKEHFDALQTQCENELVHIQVVSSSDSFLKIERRIISPAEEALILHFRTDIWRLKELLTLFLVIYIVLRKKVNKNYSILNFHIAYPLVTYPNILKRVIKIPIAITEHWSAYHFNFGMKKGSEKLSRVRNIFKHRIPIITVSNALAEDIKNFSEEFNLENFVVPNVIDGRIFNYKQKENLDLEAPTFFMVNNWRTVKSPFVIMEAFYLFLQYYPCASLRIGGYGPLVEKMESFIKERNLGRSITLIGKLFKAQIAEELQNASAFLQASSYETFSVVTAEALACGTPVVASNISAIAEFVDKENGILVENTMEEWLQALISITKGNKYYCRKTISEKTLGKFSKESVGLKYKNVLQEIVYSTKN